VEIDIHGRKAEVPDGVRAQAQSKLSKLGRLAPVLERAEVRLTQDRDAPTATRHVCEVTVEGHGHVLRARARAHDLAVAVDLVVEKLEHQAERLKGKLVGRSHPRKTKVLS
jgi:ribosomal subunit interface protein